MQEYYKILNISENATDEEVDLAYKELKEKYSRERFLEGENGNQAAKNLTKLEAAYHEITVARKAKSCTDGKNYNFSEVESLIKKGDISAAQEILDDINERNAEWHYLQSVIFYKKNWFNESKKQLEIALSLEPHNVKYSEDFAKLKQKLEYNEKQFNSNGRHSVDENDIGDRQMGGGAGNCLSFCATWCCMDMLCTMCCR